MKQINRAFFSIWTPEMAYILGFWFADGCMYQSNKDYRIIFTSADLNHLEAIRVALASEQKIYTRAGGRCYDLPIGSKQIWHDLYRLGGGLRSHSLPRCLSSLKKWFTILCVALLTETAVYTGILGTKEQYPA